MLYQNKDESFTVCESCIDSLSVNSSNGVGPPCSYPWVPLFTTLCTNEDQKLTLEHKVMVCQKQARAKLAIAETPAAKLEPRKPVQTGAKTKKKHYANAGDRTLESRQQFISPDSHSALAATEDTAAHRALPLVENDSATRAGTTDARKETQQKQKKPVELRTKVCVLM